MKWLAETRNLKSEKEKNGKYEREIKETVKEVKEERSAKIGFVNMKKQNSNPSNATNDNNDNSYLLKQDQPLLSSTFSPKQQKEDSVTKFDQNSQQNTTEILNLAINQSITASKIQAGITLLIKWFSKFF